MPIFGITAAGNQSIKLTDFYQIATTTLGSNQSTITFDNIPQTYTHLQLRSLVQNTYTLSTGVDLFTLAFNSDTTYTNYRSHYLAGSGSSASSTSTQSASHYGTSGAMARQASSNTFAATVIDILDYTNSSKNKTIRGICGADLNGSGNVFLTSAAWFSNSAITKIDITGVGYTFATYSSFALYGVKA